MATTVADVAVRVGADLGPLQRNMRKGGRSLDQFSRQAGQTAKKVAAITAAVGLASAAIGVRMVNATNKSIDAQAKLARQLDGTIDGLRAVQLAGSDAGVETSVLNAAMERLTSRLGEAMEGTGEAAKAIETLGLNAADLAGMDIDERMATIADRMETLGLSAAQAGNMLRDFGVRNGEVINLMRQGGDAIRNASVEVERFGLSLSEVDAAEVERAQDAMSRVGLAAEGLQQTLAVELADTITAVAGQLQEEFVGASNNMRDGVRDAVDAGVNSFADLLDAAAGIAEFIETNPTTAQFGLLGYLILGKKGLAIGGALGVVFDQINAFAERYGIGISEAEHTLNQVAELNERIGARSQQIVETQDDLNKKRRDGHELSQVELDTLARQEETLLRLTMERNALESSARASVDYEQEMAQWLENNTEQAGSLAESLRNVANAARDSVGGGDEEGQPQIAGLPTPEEMEARIGELMPIQEAYQNDSLTSYMEFQERRAQAAQDAADKQIAITEEEEASKKAIREENYQASFELASAFAGMIGQLAGNRVQDERDAARDIIDTMNDKLSSSKNMTEEEEKAVRASAKEKVKAREEEAKRAFETQKRMQLAAVGVNTAAAIMMHLATDPNPYAKWAGIAAIGLTGATQAAAIAGSSFGGGFKMPSSGGGSGAQAQQGGGGGGQQQNVNLNLSLVGDSFSRSQVMGLGREMVDEINNALDDGAQLRVSGT